MGGSAFILRSKVGGCSKWVSEFPQGQVKWSRENRLPWPSRNSLCPEQLSWEGCEDSGEGKSVPKNIPLWFYFPPENPQPQCSEGEVHNSLSPPCLSGVIATPIA